MQRMFNICKLLLQMAINGTAYSRVVKHNTHITLIPQVRSRAAKLCSLGGGGGEEHCKVPEL